MTACKKEAILNALNAVKLAKQKVLRDIQTIQAASQFVKEAQIGEWSDYFDNDKEAGISNDCTCGTPIDPDHKYCPNCGDQVKGTPEGKRDSYPEDVSPDDWDEYMDNAEQEENDADHRSNQD